MLRRASVAMRKFFKNCFAGFAAYTLGGMLLYQLHYNKSPSVYFQCENHQVIGILCLLSLIAWFIAIWIKRLKK